VPEIVKLEKIDATLTEQIENTKKTTKSEQSDPHIGLDIARFLLNIPRENELDENKKRVDDLQQGIKTALKVIDDNRQKINTVDEPAPKK